MNAARARGLDAVNARAREGIALLAVVALGAIVRWPFVTTGLWRDEAISVADVAPASLGASLHEIAAAEISPPGYFLALKAWLAVVGTSDLTVKLPSFLCGLAVIALTYALGRRAGGARAGLLAATFAACANEAVVLAGDARPYALAALLAAAAALCALRVLAGSGVRWVAAYACLACAVASVQYTGIVLVASFALVAAVRALVTRERAGALRLLVATVAAAVAYAPLVPHFARVASAPVPWRGTVASNAWFGRAAEQFSYALPVDVAHVAFALAAAVALLGAIGANRRAFTGDARRATEWALLVVPVLAATALETRAGLGDPRYMFAYTPLADAALAAGLVALARSLRGALRMGRVRPWDAARGIFAAALVAIVAGSASKQAALDRATLARPELSGMRAAMRATVHAFDERTLVVIAPDYLAPAFRYYVPDERVRVVGFARRDRPQVARWQTFYLPWLQPNVAGRAERDVRARLARARSRLAIVSDPDAGDAGRVPYALARTLRARLIAGARVIEDRTFYGRYENVEVTILAAPQTR